MEHTEESDLHTEEIIEPRGRAVSPEPPTPKPKKKMTYTPEQLEKKRLSMKKAREFRNISYKEEVKTLKKKLEEKETEPEPEPEEEPEPEPVIIKKKQLPPPSAKPKPTSAKPKPKQKIIYQEEEEEEEEEEYEEVIVRRRPKKNIPQYIERPDLIDESYKEQLKKQLQEERRRQVMADLFDF